MDELVDQLNAAYQRLRLPEPSGAEGATPRPTNGTSIATAKSSERSSPATTSLVVQPAPSQQLVVDDADQVRSEGTTPRAAFVVSPLAPTSSGRSTGLSEQTLPAVLSATPQGCSQRELDVYHAAERICQHISGVDYRRIALEATRANDLVTRLLKEELTLASHCEWVPSYLVARQADRLRNLFQETKAILVRQGVPVPEAILRLATTPPPGMLTSSGSSGAGALSPGGNRPRSVSVDAAAAGGRKGTRSREGSITRAAPLQPAPEEAYDVRVMHSAFDDHTDAHTQELEDELMVLKTKIEKLQREKKELLGTVDRQESQLAALRTKLTKDTEVIYMAQRQMQADLQQLAVQSGHRDLFTSDDELNVSPHGGVAADQSAPNFRKPHPPQQKSGGFSARPSGAATPQADEQLVVTPPAAVSVPCSGEAKDSVASAVNNSCDDNHATQQSAARHPGVHTDANHMSSKYNRLDALYSEVYRGKGMELLWAAIDHVFKYEYDAQQHDVSQNAPLLASEATGGTSPSKLADTLPEGEARAIHLRNAHARFLEELRSSVLARIETFEAFRSATVESTPLRSDYVAQCMQARVKPNSGVVALLSGIAQDGDVETLDLSGNYVGDGGLAPILSIVNRFYRLKTLRLADNGIKNNGVRLLAHVIRNHGSLTALDLSKNSITRTAGRDLLNLVASMPKLTSIDLSGTHIDSTMMEKIEKRLSVNSEGGSHPVDAQAW